MQPSPLSVLVVGVPPGDLADPAWGPFDVRPCADLDAATAALAEGGVGAVLLCLPGDGAARAVAAWPALPQAVLAAAVVVVAESLTPELQTLLIERGVQDVLPAGATIDALGRALHAAVLRHRLLAEARSSWSTDLATGLPNQAQLLEHMNHLLALREREPAPMALVVVRIEGLAAAQASLGAEAVGVLRRKLAVRARAALRASDVVASLGSDAFGVLLAWIDAPQAAMAVAAKLARALSKPVQIGARVYDVGLGVGVGRYPEDGRDARTLLQLAQREAAEAPTAWRTTTSAANDEPM